MAHESGLGSDPLALPTKNPKVVPMRKGRGKRPNGEEPEPDEEGDHPHTSEGQSGSNVPPRGIAGIETVATTYIMSMQAIQADMARLKGKLTQLKRRAKEDGVDLRSAGRTQKKLGRSRQELIWEHNAQAQYDRHFHLPSADPIVERDPLVDAYDEGAQAAYNGDTPDHCPHGEGTAIARAWLKGHGSTYAYVEKLLTAADLRRIYG